MRCLVIGDSFVARELAKFLDGSVLINEKERSYEMSLDEYDVCIMVTGGSHSYGAFVFGNMIGNGELVDWLRLRKYRGLTIFISSFAVDLLSDAAASNNRLDYARSKLYGERMALKAEMAVILRCASVLTDDARHKFKTLGFFARFLLFEDRLTEPKLAYTTAEDISAKIRTILSGEPTHGDIFRSGDWVRLSEIGERFFGPPGLLGRWIKKIFGTMMANVFYRMIALPVLRTKAKAFKFE